MSYETFRSSKRWTPRNVTCRPRPNPMCMVTKQHGKKAARRLASESRRLEKMMNELGENEQNAIDAHEKVRKNNGEIVEVSKEVEENVEQKVEVDDEEDGHYGVYMCMWF